MRTTFPAALLTTALATGLAVAQSAEQQLVAQGKSILTEKCSRCHQIGPSGRSPLGEAPPFRTLMGQYKAEHLEEALGEGLSSGHSVMPEFVFEPEQISAIVAYLGTLERKR
jgi:mono/diheme cytochrome c family protein